MNFIDNNEQAIATFVDPLTGKQVSRPATHSRIDPISAPDMDQEAMEASQRHSDALNQIERDRVEQSITSDRMSFEDLYPSEQRLWVERHYTDLIRKLDKAHVEACDAVTDFENSELTFRGRIQAEYAFTGKHPDVKVIYCAGDEHFKHLITSGELNVDGYKMVDKRTTTGNASQLFLIPQSVPNLLSYADSSEAKALSQTEYQRDLDRLISKRKAAAVQLTETKKAARESLAAIPTFEDLVSDVVKRTKKAA